ncbi:MAG TPA: GNAT family N-acetyltransferase [Jatrophihabitantaceae bacterium]|jgi:GNAT superfamily N-acetyltransferase
MTVRPATDDDADMLAALRRAWVEEDAGPVDDPGYAQAFVDWYDREGDRRLAWIGFVDGAPVGMLSMLEYRRMPLPGRLDSRWGYISNVFVLGRHRNHGLGRELLDAALTAARERHYVRLVLSPSERAIPFYGRAGFVPADELMIRRMD